MSTRRLRIAAAQISSGNDVAENLNATQSAIRAAGQLGVELAVLPEAAMIWFGSDIREAAEPLDGPFANSVRFEANRSNVTVCVGMFEPAENGRVYNTTLITGPDGEWCYRKIHLFDAFGMRESETVAPGKDYVTATIRGSKVGFATCYDLRFASQFTELGRRGAEVIAVSASWGDGPAKSDQWDLLVRARASDAQSWVVACGQAWRAPQGSVPLGIGRSAVVDPTGAIRAQLNSGLGMLVHDIDLDLVADTRERIPIL